MASKAEARGELLAALRLSRGLTQVELATAVGISQATLSKVESGEARLDLETWRNVAKELLVPLSAFRAVQSSTAPARIFHRKQRTTPKSAVNKVAAELSLVRLRVRDLMGDQTTTLRRHDREGGFNTPQEIARDVRDELGLGRGPLDDLVAILEDAGVLVLRWPLGNIQVDAIASWQDDNVPVILIGEHVPADRQRFTMAHELGHAVMHDDEAEREQEAEADAFAAEFLAPGSEIAKEWPADGSLDSLLLLKKRWGISLSALIRRGKDTGRLTEQEYRHWSIQLSTTGMHRREPDPTERENPTALTTAIRKSLDEGASLEELASSAHMYPREFQLTFLEETS
ncbi:hypothetical protein DEA06_08585 [Microbacterium sp. Gd 4-13]|uniref:XRE family transcriptional regulator n=1 Tax=Microbacterium sp. Gd 4-13 TaxID=2173179 RepID=UPI000D578AF9|nr:XRE family transcriptional regulator [Microbacterium sp. Gd 4-13]PVW04816.1 hypothetical protein DEA06_08585 [Microbacterium sp. Gd 4-13]